MYEYYNPHERSISCCLHQIGSIIVRPGECVPTPEQEAKGIKVETFRDFISPSLLHATPPAKRRLLLESSEKAFIPHVPAIDRSSRGYQGLETKSSLPKNVQEGTKFQGRNTRQELENSMEEALGKIAPLVNPTPSSKPASAPLQPAQPASAPAAATPPAPVVQEAVKASPAVSPAEDPLSIIRKLKEEIEAKKNAAEPTADELQKIADAASSSGSGKKGKRIETP